MCDIFLVIHLPTHACQYQNKSSNSASGNFNIASYGSSGEYNNDTDHFHNTQNMILLTFSQTANS